MAHTESSIAAESRSHRAVLSWQLQGVVSALRLTIQCGLTHGNHTLALLANIRKHIEDPVNGLGLGGVAIDNVPQLTDDSCPAEVLVVAEAFYGLVLCLLAPDERNEQRGNFRFPVR